ncbi:oxidoreductase [Nonomuraea sediminis]|uniref:oxidoreductase n=1 Tax=Nonomuraea sediminis TaxID=2835864 RepID=UPI001BDCC0E6|nr:oxidoreductase [Nonomuraea sediminis]
MKSDLYGKRAIVTGGSRGIGLAIARALTDEGASVVVGARERPPDLPFVEADLSEPHGPGALVETAIPLLGGLDILVNNVGSVRPRVNGFLSVTDDDWTTTLTINLLAAVRTTRAALPYLLDQGHGSVITIASVNARLPDPLVVDYSAAKGALVNFCKSLSKEVAARGIRVNTVSPGPVATGLWLGAGGVAETVAGATGGTADAVAAQAAGESITGRFTTPEEVAALVVFLAGDAAANITGSDFTIDGGLITTL